MNKFLLVQSFITVVEEGSFTAAAEKMGKTKALISTQISQLESYLKVKLFMRSTRQMALTDNGQEYYRGCKALLEQWESLEAGLCENLDSISGSLRVTAPLNFGQKTISPIISEFIKSYPDIKIDLNLTDRHVDLIQDSYDFAFRIGILEDSRLIAIPLQTFDMIVCASQDYLKSHPPIKSPNDLKQHNCIVDTQHKDQSKWQFYIEEKSVKVKVNQIYSVNNAYAAANAAADGIGITRIPFFAAEECLKMGKLVQILEDFCQDPHTLYLIYPDRKYQSRKSQVFKKFITEQLKQAHS